MDAPNPNQLCHDVSSTIQNPNSLPSAPGFDLIISLLLSFPDSSSPSFDSSSYINQLLDKALASASSDVFVQNSLVDRTIRLVSLLHESTKQCFRKRASAHNSNSWLLPPELTIKVFSKLDKKSLVQAMSCCTMFQKWAMDPFSYSHINLTTSASKVDDEVVRTMIRRAGKELRSLELGHVLVPPYNSTTPLLTGKCLAPLSDNDGFIGKCLRSIHLYNVRSLTLRNHLYINALSACSNITDLKIVGSYASPEKLLESLTAKRCFIEHLFLETYTSYPGRLKFKESSSSLADIFTNIPNLTSLTLIGFRLNDARAQILVESARKLKYMNLSRNLPIKGHFLRGSGHSCKDSLLETLILRDCYSLEEKEVLQFLNSLSKGDFRSIRHIDVSNNRGLLSDEGIRSYKPKFPLEKLKEERSDVTFVADFGAIKSTKVNG